MTAHGTTELIAKVESLKGLQTLFVELVRAVQKVDFAILVPFVGVVANWTVAFISGNALVSDGLPEVIKFLFLSRAILLFLCANPLLLPNTRHVGNETIEKLLRIFNALIYLLNRTQNFFPLLRHECQVPLSNPAEFVTDKSLSDIFIFYMVPFVFDTLIEVVSCQKSAGQ